MGFELLTKIGQEIPGSTFLPFLWNSSASYRLLMSCIFLKYFNQVWKHENWSQISLDINLLGGKFFTCIILKEYVRDFKKSLALLCFAVEDFMGTRVCNYFFEETWIFFLPRGLVFHCASKTARSSGSFWLLWLSPNS